jgi:thioredoxin-related protein
MKYSTLFLSFIVLAFVACTSAGAQDGDKNTAPVSLEQALKLASENDKKILIDVYAEWCPYCQRMQSQVYKDSTVLQAISDHFIWVQINIESESMVNYLGHEMTETQFARALENESVPTTYFLNNEGSILGKQPGYIESETFSKLLNFVGSDAFLTQSFQEFMER